MTYFNISIDDVEYLFFELISNQNKISSIFDTQLLGFLKKLHNLYGVKFTLFSYSEVNGFPISEMPLKFKSQFEESSDWLKFGFHWPSRNYNPSISNERLNLSIKTFYSALINFAGRKSVSSFIRLHYFHCFDTKSVDFLSVSQICGKVILLAPSEESRPCYDLTESERKSLHETGVYMKNDIEYAISDYRLESMNIFHLPDSLKIKVNNIIYPPHLVNGCITSIYTHEWYLKGIGKRRFLSQLIKGDNITAPGFVARYKFKKLCKYLYESDYVSECIC